MDNCKFFIPIIILTGKAKFGKKIGSMNFW